MAIAKKIFGFVKEFMVAIFDLVLFLTGICTMLQWDEEPLCFHLGFALIIAGLVLRCSRQSRAEARRFRDDLTAWLQDAKVGDGELAGAIANWSKQVCSRANRLLIAAVVAFLAVLIAVMSCVSRPAENGGIDGKTKVERKSLRFYQDGAEWYADVYQHAQSENRMVAGAGALIGKYAQGTGELRIVFSADVAEPGEWELWLHRVEHDRFGAFYRVKTAGSKIPFVIWLCNVTHTVCGGEHPRDIYVHSIEPGR